MKRGEDPEGIKQGDEFGALTVVRFVGRNDRYQAKFEVKCACGRVSEVLGTNLKKGNTTRCNAGVHRAEHGMIATPEYLAWKAMNWRVKAKTPPATRRCYLDRGIKVCAEWKESFLPFLCHVGMMPRPGLTLDRIDNERGYEPGNVRWATRSEQMFNRRKKA